MFLTSVRPESLLCCKHHVAGVTTECPIFACCLGPATVILPAAFRLLDLEGDQMLICHLVKGEVTLGVEIETAWLASKHTILNVPNVCI